MSLSSLFGSVCDPNSYNYNPDSCGYGALLTFLMGIIGILLVLTIIAATVKIISRWIFFKKCGEAGWKALIPVYEELTLLKVTGMNWWWIFIIYAATIISSVSSSLSSLNTSYNSTGIAFLSLCISIIGLAASVFALLTRIGMAINITKRFHKSGGFAVLIVFFEPIMFFILGLSKSEVYDKEVKVPQNGIFGPRN